MSLLAPLLLAAAGTSTAALQIRSSPEAPRLGDLAVVYVQGAPTPNEDAELLAFGYATALDPVGQGRLRGFVPVPTDVEPGPSPVRVVVGGRVVGQVDLPVSGRAFERSHLRVSRRFTKKKPPALARRIARESARMDAVFAAEPTRPLAFGEIRRPAAGRRTSPFGVRRVFNGETKSVHYGLDLDGAVGDPVRAALAGRVVLSGARFYSGQTLVLDHGSGLFTMYFHLSKRRARPGQRVEAGARIGDVGRSGRVTGAHLHLAVAVRARYLDGERAGETRAMYVDPERFLDLELWPPAPKPR